MSLLYTVFVGVKATQPHRPHPDFGQKKKKKKGEKSGGGGGGGETRKKVEHLSVILVKAFQLWPYKYMAQVPRISNGINYKSDHRITSKTKSNQTCESMYGDCALSTADRRPSYNKYIVLTSKKMFRGTHHNYSLIIKTNLCCFGAILMRLN